MNRVALQCFKMNRTQAIKLNTVFGGILSSMSGTEQQMLCQQIRLFSRSSMKLKDGEVHPGYAKLKQKMERFQVDDGVPVHLKGGPTDVILYYFTFVMIFIGLCGTLELFYRMSFPQKPK